MFYTSFVHVIESFHDFPTHFILEGFGKTSVHFLEAILALLHDNTKMILPHIGLVYLDDIFASQLLDGEYFLPGWPDGLEVLYFYHFYGIQFAIIRCFHNIPVLPIAQI